MIVRRACWAALVVIIPIAVACKPPMPATPAPDASWQDPDADTLHALCQGRCVLVDRAGKPVSSCSYGRIAQGTDGFSVVNEGGSKVIVSTDGPRFLPGDFQILEVHGNGLIEARITTTGGEQVAFYNRAGQRVRHFDTGGGHHRLEVDSWVGAPVVTRCASEGCTASVLGPDGRTTAQFARLNVLEGQDVAAASTDGRHFGLIDTQLSWQGRRD